MLTEKKWTFWTEEEQDKFIEGCKIYGKDWEKVTRHIGTRSFSSVNHFWVKLKKMIKIDPSLDRDKVISTLSKEIYGEKNWTEDEKQKFFQGVK